MILICETTNDDYIIDRSDNFVKNFIETFELYRDNVTNVDENTFISNKI